MTVYSYLQVLEASTDYFNGDELAAKVFVDKYALQNKNGEYLELTPKDMHHRLAKEFARIEAKYPNPMSEDEIFNLLDHYKFIVPQGSPMFGIGNEHYVQSLGNCFVVESAYDSYGGILKTDQELVQLMKRRAGVGTDLSNIRPKGLPTNNAAKTTDGIGIFLDRFSNSCREVAQSGRRGALLLSNHISHPEIETFINIKQDNKRVTGANLSTRITDKFMNAVKNNEDFILQWPVESTNPILKNKVKAKDIWDQIINCAWRSAEPGLLFWDNIVKNSPADIYAEKYPNFKTQSTNPCFSGDTLIAVADGRNAITIKQLAEENKDVPVYSVDKQGAVSIKMGRNPRITGSNKKIIKINLDDGSYIKVTPEHKFILLDGEEILAKNLKNGDSLPRFNKTLDSVKKGGKDYYSINSNTLDNSKKIYEHRLIAKYFYSKEWKKLYKKTKKNGFAKTGGLVIHHKDYNSLNNSPDNLQIMTFGEHSKLHGELDQAGENNGRFCGVSNDEMKQHGINLTKKIGRRFSKKDWIEYAQTNKLPKGFSFFRKNELGNILEFAKWCAIECNMEYIDADPRSVKIYKEMLSQGYNARIENNIVLVEKTCEHCSKKYETEHSGRERGCCSQLCGAAHFAEQKMHQIKIKQSKIYSELLFSLKRNPLMKEWEQACEQNGITHRVGLNIKYGFHNFEEVAEAGQNYNHKVVSIENIDGEHDVYNITVDNNHTLAVITSINDNKEFSGIYVANCGELPLGLDSCRLLVVNLLSFVDCPFTSSAKFNFNLFAKVSQKAQRLMDDLIDLEIEKINRIILKIENDPEPEAIKSVELNMWKQFLQSCIQGRRTGTGITALGDCLAALGIKYGSQESISMTEEIYKNLMINAYKSSFIMAGERGSFPIFDSSLEINHPFINHVLSQNDELKSLYNLYGRRNIALLTTAPTGSVSTQTQTTSGIEPVFMLSYVRRKKHNPSDKNARVDFIDAMGDQWQEFTVYHHGLKKWMDITGETDFTKSPYYNATANEIDWAASVDLQAIAQKYIDHSISKTCNLPENATKELVAEVYMRAWEKGCKGFTVYRDKCRDGVLINVSESKINKDGRPDAIGIAEAPKRPTELICDIKKVKVQGEAWTFFVGLLNDKPYEIFGGLSKYIDIPNKYKTGKIIKNGKVDGLTVYNLIIGENDEQILIKNIANVFENANFGSFTRVVSLSLRHGTPIQYIVEQLQKDKYSDITSFSKVIARVLKKYIQDGTKSTIEKKCPQCEAENSLAYQEGCISCKNCTYSKC